MQGYTAPVEIEGKQELTGIQIAAGAGQSGDIRDSGYSAGARPKHYPVGVDARCACCAGEPGICPQVLGQWRPHWPACKELRLEVRAAGLRVRRKAMTTGSRSSVSRLMPATMRDSATASDQRQATPRRASVLRAPHGGHDSLCEPAGADQGRCGLQLFALRKQRLRTLDPELALVDQHPLTWFMETMIWGQQRFIAALFAIFSFLGLVLGGDRAVQRGVVLGGPAKPGDGNSHGAGRAKGRHPGTGAEVGGRAPWASASSLDLALSIGLNRVVAHWVQSSSRDPLAVVYRGGGSGSDCAVCLHLAGATCGDAGSDEGAAHGVRLDYCWYFVRLATAVASFSCNSSLLRKGARPLDCGFAIKSPPKLRYRFCLQSARFVCPRRIPKTT